MKRALVIIDMQYGFVNDDTRGLVDKIKKYVKENTFDEIVCTAYENNENTACYKFEGWKKCMTGSHEARVVKELQGLSSKVFIKHKYSCWNEEFKQWVKDNKIDILYFVGVNTGCCVLHSAFDAYNDLQDCRVVEDLCKSTSGAVSHNMAISILKECITRERVIRSGLCD